MQSTAESLPQPVEAPTDGDLIDATLRGDSRGYEQLTRRYQDRLFTSVLHDAGCPVLAEDIVQDAFVKAYLHLSTFRKESNFYTWLYRIALNARSTYYRRRQRMLSLESLGNDCERISTAHRDSPSRALERREECWQVREALKRLDEHYRTVLVLREFDGFDYQTIAQLLELKVGTVRSRLSRAREQMRRQLATYVTETVADPRAKVSPSPVLSSPFDATATGSTVDTDVETLVDIDDGEVSERIREALKTSV
ncbi:MAG: RNA polymerase sigma factor [Rubripirellula sp.]